jgi:hypothetical protein
MGFFWADLARGQKTMPILEEAMVFLHVDKLSVATFAEGKATTAMLSDPPERFDDICVLGDGRCVAILSPRNPVPPRPPAPQATSRPSEGKRPWCAFVDRGGLKVAALHPSDLPSYQGSPAVSPDGASIVYVGGEKFQALYQVDLGTGKCSVLLDGKSQVIAPAWSPDGKKLAYYRAEEGPALHRARLCLRVLRLDPKEDTQVAGLSNIVRVGGEARWPPIWSADGRKVFFEAAYGDLQMSHVYVVSVDPPGPPMYLVGPGGSFSLGENGLLITIDGGICELPLGVGANRRLLVEKACGPKMSPQGKFLAYSKMMESGLHVRILPSGMETTVVKNWGGDLNNYYWTQLSRFPSVPGSVP